MKDDAQPHPFSIDYWILLKSGELVRDDDPKITPTEPVKDEDFLIPTEDIGN
jgi:hypothetical protein